ncbi:MAG: phosphonopyruvate decarboxylase [Betaproteobacteria bacterium]|nr:phosphonopyruvate decarboxylase [Betaproteobacteria bacterium]
MNTPTWPDELYEALMAADVRQVGYVPDAGHRRLIERCHANPQLATTSLTTEEEGIGLMVGAYLGGQRGVLLMQSSGVGNCINMLSLTAECRIPLVMLVTMRGEWGEFVPWQVWMGQGTPSAFESMGVLVYRVDERDQVADTVKACTALAFNTRRQVAVLIGQKVIGTKPFK